MSAHHNRLVEIGRRYSTDRQLFASLTAAAAAVTAVPTYSVLPAERRRYDLSLEFVGREFYLEHRYHWGPGTISSRAQLRDEARHVVARLEIRDRGEVWNADQPTGLRLPADAAEVLALLLTLAGDGVITGDE